MFKRGKKEKKESPLRLPNVTFSMPDIRHEMWKCNRCGSPVFDGELELHSSFHKTQDVLLEKMMIALDKFEGVTSPCGSDSDSDPLPG